ncbi:hypothetical protein [Wolbachia pipientis]|nr:hypothetical protein [Wolbachia pipientis]MDM8334900.1 hypothetical protein [Wolbachia pipientis]
MYLFRTLFGTLNQYESEYIQHVKAKSRGSNAICNILSAIEKD